MKNKILSVTGFLVLFASIAVNAASYIANSNDFQYNCTPKTSDFCGNFQGLNTMSASYANGQLKIEQDPFPIFMNEVSSDATSGSGACVIFKMGQNQTQYMQNKSLDSCKQQCMESVDANNVSDRCTSYLFQTGSITPSANQNQIKLILSTNMYPSGAKHKGKPIGSNTESVSKFEAVFKKL